MDAGTYVEKYVRILNGSPVSQTNAEKYLPMVLAFATSLVAVVALIGRKDLAGAAGIQSLIAITVVLLLLLCSAVWAAMQQETRSTAAHKAALMVVSILTKTSTLSDISKAIEGAHKSRDITIEENDKHTVDALIILSQQYQKTI